MKIKIGGDDFVAKIGDASSVFRFGTDWIGVGDRAAVPNYREAVPADTVWRTDAELTSALSVGGDIDLGGNAYRITSSKKLTSSSNPDVTSIRNGIISGAQEIQDNTWSTLGDGIYSASAPALDGSDLAFHLEDLTNSNRPKAAQWPRFDTSGYSSNLSVYETDFARKYRFSASPHWVHFENPGTGFHDANTITWIDIDRTIESAIGITEANATEFFVGALGGATQIVFSKVTAYDAGNMRLTVSLGMGTPSAELYFAFYGSRTLIVDDDEYAYSPGSQSIHYKASYGSPTTVGIPAQGNFFQYANGVDLENMVFLSSNSDGDTATGMITANGSDPARMQITDCKFYNTWIIGHNLVFDMNRVQCYDTIERGFNTASSSSASSITNSRFVGTEEKSWLFLNGALGTIERTSIRGCYFEAHGAHAQAISVYQNLPKNCDIRNNIFHNCRAAIALHGNTLGDDSSGTATNTAIENNLFVTNKGLNAKGYSSQAHLVVFTSVTDTLDWELRVRYNTLSGNLIDDNKLARGSNSFTFANNANTTSTNQRFYYEGNICKGSLVSLQAGNGGAYYASNASCTEGVSPVDNPWRLYAPSFGPTDLDTPSGGTSDYLDERTFLTSGLASTAAPDNGRIGIRWERIPMEANFATLRLDFESVANPTDVSGYPLQESSGKIAFNTDDRS